MYFFEKEDINPAPLPFNIIKWKFASPDGVTICFQKHNHEALELILVLSGCLKVNIDNKRITMRSGDLAIFNPFTLHSGKCDESTEYICFTADLRRITIHSQILSAFSKELLCGAVAFDDYFSSDSHITEKATKLLGELSGKINSPTPLDLFRSFSLIFELLSVLSPAIHKTKENPRQNTDRDFMRSVSMYLSEKYTTKIGIADICRHLNYEKSGFCHKFKRCFKDTFSCYLSKYRVTRACERFSGTDTPISTIAAECGFEDYSYFSRIFKKYIGMTPREYFSK